MLIIFDKNLVKLDIVGLSKKISLKPWDKGSTTVTSLLINYCVILIFFMRGMHNTAYDTLIVVLLIFVAIPRLN
jgi:hypothetical protein